VKGHIIGKENLIDLHTNPTSLEQDSSVSRRDYKIEEEDKKLARKNPDKFFAVGLTNRGSGGNLIEDILEVFVIAIFNAISKLNEE